MLCRVDIEIPPLGMLCILCYLPLSIRKVPQYSAVRDTSMPLTEPDLQISHIRLFSYPHFAGVRVPARYELEFRLHPVSHFYAWWVSPPPSTCSCQPLRVSPRARAR